MAFLALMLLSLYKLLELDKRVHKNEWAIFIFQIKDTTRGHLDKGWRIKRIKPRLHLFGIRICALRRESLDLYLQTKCRNAKKYIFCGTGAKIQSTVTVDRETFVNCNSVNKWMNYWIKQDIWSEVSFLCYVLAQLRDGTLHLAMQTY